MSTFFFGPPGEQRFGCFHPARGAAVGAAVLCPSWGLEYQYAHRALRVLAKRLSERGVHALRFDYRGTGDSWGDTTDASFDRWVQDAGLACDQLRSRAGASRVDLVGLRIGAAVACAAAAGRTDVRRLALWEPVLNGAAWVAGHGAVRSLAATPAGTGDAAVEFGQSVIAASLLQQLGELREDRYPAVSAERVLVLGTASADGASPAAAGALGQAERLHVEDVSPWLEDASIWSGQVPARAIRALTDWISR